MIEIYRIVEHQASVNSYRVTQDEEKAVQLELLVEKTKPKMIFNEWHQLIATPFRYDLPTAQKYQARFKPPFSNRNVFYGSIEIETVYYEHAYHFILERAHLAPKKKKEKLTETGERTVFSVLANNKTTIRIHNQINIKDIMDKKNYSQSHKYIESNPNVDFIVYPSCRDPKSRDNAAILNIKYLEKSLKSESSKTFFYDYKKKFIKWLDINLIISWKDVWLSLV